MKVIAINGSPKADGNTGTALEIMAEELKNEGIGVEIIHVGNKTLQGCIACGGCLKNENNHCVLKDDIVNSIIDKMEKADGFILGSPTYFAGIAGTMKCFLDRAFFSSYRNGKFRNKVGTAVAAVRRSGGVEVFNQLNNYLNLTEAVIPPSQYWMAIHGMEKGEILQDFEGIQTIKRNANAMAWMIKVLKNSKEELPRLENRATTNFIR